MITNVLHPHLFEVMTWLLTDDIPTETTPKATSAFLAKMHVLAELRCDLRRRYPVRSANMVTQRSLRSKIGEALGSFW
jgi:hypothetical protein